MPGRWPPLEERVLRAVSDGTPPTSAELAARLEVVAGNEWVVAEAVDDLVAAGALRRGDGDDGPPRLHPAA